MTTNSGDYIWLPHEGKAKEIHEVVVPHVGNVPVVKGELHELREDVQEFIIHWIRVCKPRAVYLCDGSQEEADLITNKLVERGTLRKLRAYKDNYICCTDPNDVARVESKTFICTKDKYKTVPHLPEGVKGIMGQWISPDDLSHELQDRFHNCMCGRMMYVMPFSMGPIGSPLSKIGVQITDSNYVVLCMRIMSRVSPHVWSALGNFKEVVKCVHSVGCPRPVQYNVVNHWACNPEKTIITHLPEERMILSYGSGYGGNSLLGKKCFALRIASNIAYDEGWLAEHMLIMGVTNPQGVEKFIVAAFPSACGKTNMAMLEPSLPGYKVRVVGDDIAWMRFDENDGQLYAINPEGGFFGVAPGTNYKTNPNAMRCFQGNSIFTNVAETEHGEYYWEGLEKEVKDPENLKITSWLGKPFKIGDKTNAPAAHPNSRFCCPASQCPIIHPKWEDPKGVPISAIIFGGRRPEGIPVVLECFDWAHGVMVGASVKSETTAAAEFKGKNIMHDPMAMRPFMGYNFGRYLDHWLSMDKVPNRKVPKIFHVNWFRLDENNKFVWPGFGENIRVIDWIMRRVDGEDIAEPSPIGNLPKKGSLNCEGIDVDWDKMFHIDKKYLLEDILETEKFLESQAGTDLPDTIRSELKKQEQRIRQSS